MIKTIKLIHVSFLVLIFSLALNVNMAKGETEAPTPSAAQMSVIRQAVDSGQVSPHQVQQGLKMLESGQISPETIDQYRKKAEMGTLSPSEIETGKRMLEQKQVDKGEKEVIQPDIMDIQEEEYADLEKDKDRPSYLEIFGHNLFSQPPGTFAPIRSAPVSSDYVIGPGDEIKILMWGRLDASYSLIVDNEGVIQFPKIGPLTVAGLTFTELKELIRQKAEAITGVNVNVSMGELRSIQVYILGEVKSPGVYTVSSLATVTNALLISGGPTWMGSLRKVQLKRNHHVESVVDFYDFLIKGDTSANVRLMPGDVIFVPQAGTHVMISGKVRRPAIYELKGDLTLKNALELAGGLMPRAFNQRIQIERALENRVQVVLDISYEELTSKSPIYLQAADIVKVSTILPASVNAIYLYGNVLRPGEYAYTPDLKILDILPDLESFDLDTYFPYALIKRYQLNRMEAELIPFDLGRLILENDLTQNIPLMPLDEIYIFNKDRFEDKEYAAIGGQVRKPGKYFIDDMTIKDLILKAGDLTDDAFLEKGELIRIDENRNKHTLYFNVIAAKEGHPDHNLRLQKEDTVIIHSIWEDRWKEAVTISGLVKHPGEFALTHGMRLKDLIFKAGQPQRDAYTEIGHLYRTHPDTKDVTIFTFHVEKAMAGDPKENMILQDLDKVVIHSIWEYKEKYEVTVNGVVNNPGSYPHAENMTVKDLIVVSGNVRDDAYLEEAELVRYHIVEGKTVETTILKFNLRMALDGDPGHNLTLYPLDVLTVKQIPDWREKKRTVSIAGEVTFPGTYQVRKDERLSTILQRAGGYTEYAYLMGAMFTRESVRQIQQKRIDDMADMMESEIMRLSSQEAQAAFSQEDIDAMNRVVASQKAILAKLRNSRASGRVTIKLVPLDEFQGSEFDMILEDGDKLYLPPKPSTVNVLGAVYNPNAHIFNQGYPQMKYYLNQSGGPTINAEDKDIYIIRADGTVISKSGHSFMGISWNNHEKRWGFWGRFENTELYPGDTILVPEKIERPSFIKNAKDITQILYQIAVTAGITIQQIF